MYLYSSTPVAPARNGAAVETSAPDRLVDDLLRRILRVADPRSPDEVAQALRQRYTAAAARIDEEGAGLPVPLGAPLAMPATGPSMGDSAGTRGIALAARHVEDDLTALVRDPATRDWMPELSGWKNALLREVKGGADAACYAQDPAQRERAFLSVRHLIDYARVARLVGCLNPEADVLQPYRRLATSLDDAAWSLRVLMGEALGSSGLIERGFITQVPVADARQRRDGLLAALRDLLGTGNDDSADWGRGPFSYGQLLDALQRAGATELTVYLREATLSQVLDDLVAQLARQDPSSLRSIASTAPVELVQLQRLLRLTRATGPNGSRELSNFIQALRLFLDAFRRTRSGARLVDLALPLPFAAEQGGDAPDGAVRAQLRELVSWRFDLAREVEGYAVRGATGARVRRTITMVDVALHWTDRAIDLVAQGQGYAPRDGGTWGEEERSAAVLIGDALNAARAPDAGSVAFLGLAAVLADPRPADLFRDVNPGHREIERIETGDVGAQLAWQTLATQLAPRLRMAQA